MHRIFRGPLQRMKQEKQPQHLLTSTDFQSTIQGFFKYCEHGVSIQIRVLALRMCEVHRGCRRRSSKRTNGTVFASYKRSALNGTSYFRLAGTL